MDGVLTSVSHPVAGEVHLHRTNLDADAERLRNEGVLSADELRRADRFRFDRDRQRFVAGRTFLRAVLGRYMETRSDQVQFTYTTHGKPELAGAGRSLHFNFSHSGEWAVLGVARCEIGVDVEQVRPVPDLDDVARRVFACREAEAVLAVDGAERVARFLTCWTRKEAFVKATGVGIGASLQDFEVAVVPSDHPRIVHGGNQSAEDWSLLAPRVRDDLIVAVAVRHANAWIGLRSLS